MTDLFEFARENDIEVMYCGLPLCKSMSIGQYVALDYSLLYGGADERVHLGHELGHCATGAFYNRYAAYDIRAQHERRANKWAIRKLIPRDDLEAAVADGRREIWELAEIFGVTETFMREAVEYYSQTDAIPCDGDID